MTRIFTLYDRFIHLMLRLLGDWFLPSIARFTFAATLLFYFWNSAMTKLGEGFFGFLSPSLNAYIQIFPAKTEAVGFDISGFNTFDWLVVTTGTWAEFILPLLIVIGLFTRIAAIGMIGFVFVQSFVDVTGHGVGGRDLGGWFDGASGSLILDQRLFWVFTLVLLVIKGAGPISLDTLFKRFRVGWG